MNKILYKVVITFLILLSATLVKAEGIPYYTNYYGIEMTEAEYNNLLNLAFTESQINYMDYQTFMDNKDIEASIIGETTKYYHIRNIMHNGILSTITEEITEEEMHNHTTLQQGQLQPPGYSLLDVSGSFYDGAMGDDYRAHAIHIINVDDETMRYKLDNYWWETPSNKSYDIAGIGIEAAKVQMASSVLFRQDWDTSSGHHQGFVCTPKSTSTGGAAIFELPSGSIINGSLQSFIYFDVMKKPNVGTLTSITALGDYAHAITTTSTNVYNYLSVNYITGLEIDVPYANSYDDMSGIIANFVGTW